MPIFINLGPNNEAKKPSLAQGWENILKLWKYYRKYNMMIGN